MARSPYPRNRRERAALETRQALDDLTQVTQINSTMQRDEMAQTTQDNYIKQQTLENARYDAAKALKDQEADDELAALKFFSTFTAAKPDSEVELNAILATHPRATASPVVRDLFAKRMADVGLNKQFSDSYKASTGGESVPVTEDGTYDLPRANMRQTRSRELKEALDKGSIDKDTHDAWAQTDEYQFVNTWAPWIAEKRGAAAVLKLQRERNEEQIGKLKDVAGAAKDVISLDAPTPAEALIPDHPKVIAQAKRAAKFTPYAEAATTEMINRIRSTGGADPNAPKSAISTLDPANP